MSRDRQETSGGSIKALKRNIRRSIKKKNLTPEEKRALKDRLRELVLRERKS